MARRKHVDPASRSIPRLAEIIRSNPGSTADRIAELASYSRTHTANVLSVMSGGGIALPVPSGPLRLWYVAEVAGPLLDEWERNRERRSNRTLSDRNQRQAARVAAQAEKARQAALKQAQRPLSMRDRIMALSKGEGGASLTATVAQLETTSSNVAKHFRLMVCQGRLFRGERPGALLRWFDTPDRAQEWAALPEMVPCEMASLRREVWASVDRPPKPAPIPKPPKPPKPPKLVAIGERIKNKTRQPSKAPPLLKGSDKRNQVIKAKPGTDATVTLHGKATDMRGTVDYSRAKITICPAPQFNYRHEYAPGSEAWTGFAAEWQRLRGAA